MLCLILFRHADADRPDGVSDFDRPLSSRGRADARAMGKLVAHHGLRPELVLISPSLRTRETWDIAAASLDGTGAKAEPALYEAAAEGALAIVRDIDEGASTAMLVGHNPWIEDLARLLVAGADRTGRKLLRDGLPTAAVATIQLPAARWRDVAPASGHLERLLAPER